MSNFKLFLTFLVLTTTPLFFAYSDHLPLLEGPVPEELIIEHNELKWVWASPCAGACEDVFTGELVPPIDPMAQSGWRYCTLEEFLNTPPLNSFFDPENNPICAAEYFDTHNQACDVFDLLFGFITSEPNGTTDETILCMDADLDVDLDTDGVNDEFDNCSETPVNEIVDSTGCSVMQLCPCDGIEEAWKNHGKYVSCVSDVAEGFFEMGLISENHKDDVVSFSASSDCGKKNR